MLKILISKLFILLLFHLLLAVPPSPPQCSILVSYLSPRSSTFILYPQLISILILTSMKSNPRSTKKLKEIFFLPKNPRGMLDAQGVGFVLLIAGGGVREERGRHALEEARRGRGGMCTAWGSRGERCVVAEVGMRYGRGREMRCGKGRGDEVCYRGNKGRRGAGREVCCSGRMGEVRCGGRGGRGAAGKAKEEEVGVGERRKEEKGEVGID